MKVTLTAFNGKLTSDPMEFPEEIRSHPEIRMTIDLKNKISFETEDNFASFETIRKVGKFVSTGKHFFGRDSELSEEYKLVEIS